MQTAPRLLPRLSRMGILGLLTLMLAGIVTPPANASTAFQFRGSGWGHGVGMSQYGALELARDGKSAERIISHYYQGASATARGHSFNEILVGLSQNNTSLTATAKAAGIVVRFDGKDWSVPKGGTARIQFLSSGHCRLQVDGTSVAWRSTCSANLTPRSGASIGLSNESVDYSHNRIRRIRIRPNPNKTSHFHVAAELPSVNTYLYGLREVPASWPREALRAQAITARSFVVYDLLGGGFDAARCHCHVYDSVQSQVYGGSTGETAAWRDAVDSTTTQVVYAPGETGTRQGVVQAFYSSSSGGRTEAIEDSSAFSAGPRSYFTSVDDKWSLRGSNPYASWVIDVPESTIRSKLGLDDVLSITVRDRNESGSARTVVFNGTKSGNAATRTTTGDKLRGLLGLRSGYISTIFLPPFVDDDGNRFESDIAWLAASGITTGCNAANDRFCPDRAVTRGQMAAFLTRALNLPAGTATFTDSRGHLFEDDIAAIARAGITTGCSKDRTRFCPDAPVSRGQMAAFLTRAFDLPPGTATFTDSRGHLFEDDIAAIAREGITKGCSSDGTRFCPESDVTRAQLAAFLHRAPL